MQDPRHLIMFARYENDFYLEINERGIVTVTYCELPYHYVLYAELVNSNEQLKIDLEEVWRGVKGTVSVTLSLTKFKLMTRMQQRKSEPVYSYNRFFGYVVNCRNRSIIFWVSVLENHVLRMYIRRRISKTHFDQLPPADKLQYTQRVTVLRPDQLRHWNIMPIPHHWQIKLATIDPSKAMDRPTQRSLRRM